MRTVGAATAAGGSMEGHLHGLTPFCCARLGTVSCLLAQQSVATGWKWAEEEVNKGVEKETEKEAGEHAA